MAAYASRSPSGLLTRAGWEHELESSTNVLPRSRRTEAERHRAFLKWVEATAASLAIQLLMTQVEQAADPEIHSALMRTIDAFRADRDWATAQLAELDMPAYAVAAE